jgi:hypothetical protein
MLINHTFLNILIFHPKHATHCTIFWNYPWYIWTYSKVLKSSKTDIFNIQLVRIYKTTYIFYNFIIYKNNSFSVSKTSPGCIRLLTWTSPRILVIWTLHWRINWSLQSGHYPANIVTLDYAMGFVLGHLNYPRAHPLHYPLLRLSKYPKLLLY